MAKRLAFAALGSPPAVAAKLRAIRSAGVLTILNLHRVGPDDGSTYRPLDPGLFDQLLRFVRRNFEVVTFADLGKGERTRKPRLILSFDDGYADFATHAAPLLEKHGLRANLNIIPDCVETGRPPLNIVVQDFAGRAPRDELYRIAIPGLDADPRRMSRAAFGRALGMFVVAQPIAKQRALGEMLLPRILNVGGFAPTPMLGLAELRTLARRHEIGAHSFAHASMALESDDYLRDDVRRCRRWFAEHLDRQLGIYAFPNGSFRDGQVGLVQAEGISDVLLVEEDFSAPDSAVRNRFTFDARTSSEARFRATGAWRWPKRRR